MSQPTHVMNLTPCKMGWGNGAVTFGVRGSTAPPGTIVAIPGGPAGERFIAEFRDRRDEFVLLDEQTATELLDVQARQAAAYRAELEKQQREREAAEAAEAARQERRDALVSLAKAGVPVPPGLDNG